MKNSNSNVSGHQPNSPQCPFICQLVGLIKEPFFATSRNWVHLPLLTSGQYSNRIHFARDDHIMCSQPRLLRYWQQGGRASDVAAAAISNAENRMTTTLRQKKVHLHGWNVEVNKTEAWSSDHMLHTECRKRNLKWASFRWLIGTLTMHELTEGMMPSSLLASQITDYRIASK